MSFFSGLIVTFLVAIAGPAVAGSAETARSSSGSKAVTAGSSLPKCFDKESHYQAIKKIQRANNKAARAVAKKAVSGRVREPSKKYDGYRELFRKEAVDEDEILHRLIYAEVVAGHCGQDQSQAVTLVAEVIHNRIRRREGKIGSVVFGYNQFASSLNMYQESAYKDFLCPKDPVLWAEVKKQSNGLRTGKQQPSLAKDAYHYYLFKHSTRFQPPAWTKTYPVAGQVASTDGLCVVSYTNSKWK